MRRGNLSADLRARARIVRHAAADVASAPMPPHQTRIRVRFDEVDQMNVVHHPRYLVYFEVARTQWLRDLGLPYRDVVGSGTHLAVVEVGVRHLRPARYDEELTVTTRCTELGGARVALGYEIRRGDEVLATGFTRLAAIDAAGKAKRLPERLREVFAAAVAAQDAAAPVVEREEAR
jgi:acyl-CoA thioester hydrolase